MKILQVIHDFLPNHQAGSELYCYHLSKSLQSLGHDARLLFTEIDHNRRQYETREGTYDGLPFYEIVNNHSYSSVAETYNNPAIEEIFTQSIQEFQPDVAHFHHLLGLSYGCVRICKENGIPVFFTLHDYWLTCLRGGGQRFRADCDVCHDVDTSLCAECVSQFSFSGRLGNRFVKKVLNSFERNVDFSLIPAMRQGRIKTDHRDFVSFGRCEIDGDSRDVVFAHPFSRITFHRNVPEDASLTFAIAMAPSTYDKSGDGVSFQITCNGESIYECFLNAKENPEDRGWRQVTLPLKAFAGKKREFVFETNAQPTGRPDYCAACWAEPKILPTSGQRYQPSLLDRFRRGTELILSRLQKRSLKREADLRKEATRRLFEQVDLFIAPSPFLRSKFIEFGVNPKTIAFSDYGIAPIQIPSDPRPPRRPIRFTFVGTLVKHKGLHVLIEAFNGLPHDAAILNVYGSLDEFEGYVARVKAAIAHPGIALRGRVENQDIPTILAETDALIVPSIWFENSPITIHEAFLARVPVITARFGGMADLVKDEVNGLLFEVGNPDDLWRVLTRCVNKPELLETLRPDPKSVKSLEADAEWMQDQYSQFIKKI